jgi:hypothetical protein
LILKKRYRKEKYGINDYDLLLYLDPLKNGTLLQELTMTITGPRLGIQLNGDAHLHEGEKDATEAQSLICDFLKGLMQYCCCLQPYRPMHS